MTYDNDYQFAARMRLENAEMALTLYKTAPVLSIDGGELLRRIRAELRQATQIFLDETGGYYQMTFSLRPVEKPQSIGLSPHSSPPLA